MEGEVSKMAQEKLPSHVENVFFADFRDFALLAVKVSGI